MPTTDPNQQRMMALMPVFMGVIFYRYASGLNLYIMVMSLVGIAQQVFINKTMVAPAPLSAPGKTADAKE